MIDNLISSDFTVLAREHRRVPSLDAVMPRPREKVARPPLKLNRWIVRAVVGGSAVMAVRSDWFDQHPQCTPLIVLSVVSLLGLFDTGIVRDSFVRQLGAIIGAVALFASAATMFVLDHSTYSTIYISSYGVQFRRGPEGPTDPFLVVGISLLAIAGGYAIAGVLAPRIKHRLLQPWSSLAKLASTAVFMTWLGLCEVGGRGYNVVDFHHQIRPLWERLMMQISTATYDVLYRSDNEKRMYERLTDTEFDLLVAAAGIALFIVSIALAYRSKSTVATKWLAIVEHAAVAPLGVAFGMVNLSLYVPIHMHLGPDDSASYGALAMVGVLVAFTSMRLRRLRRSMVAGG